MVLELSDRFVLIPFNPIILQLTNQSGMIKFFRKIRQQLLSENRFTKYLIYAIGEIVLVVIGILIALQINNNNQAKKREIEVREILSQIQEELAINVQNADKILLSYCKKDSLIYAVLNDKINKSDYKVLDNNMTEVTELAYLILDYDELVIIDNGYLGLIKNTGNFPVRFKPLLEPLKQLYENDKKWLYDYNGLIKENVFENENYWKYNKQWYSNLYFQMKIDEEAIDFFLSDPFYKNQVTSYSEIFRVHLGLIAGFRIKAKNMFNTITTILGNGRMAIEKEYPFLIEADDYKNWYGTYSFKDVNEELNEFEIIYKENSIYELQKDSIFIEIIPLADNLYCLGDLGGFNRFIINEKNEVVGGNFHWWRFRTDINKID